MKRSVAVTIAGQSYALKSDADEQYVRSLASFVDEKIGVLLRRPTVTPAQAAILAAMQIADDLFREREGRANLRRDVRAQARQILDDLADLGDGDRSPST